MKKFYLLLLSLSMGLSSVFADGVVRTYTNVTAGSLSTRISNDNVDPLTITDLTITGNLNGTDLRLIREMAGNDYLGQPTNGSLKRLDLSGANIVVGGEKYLDTDRITSSTGTYTQNVGENSFHYETENNVLGKSLFAGCDKLEEIILPNSITSIGDYVFWFCLNLKSLEIPKNVSSIGWAFIYGSNKISNLSVAEDNHNYDSRNNCNAIIETATNTLVRGCINTIVPNDIKIIGDYAFYYCSDLPKITLPEGIISIGYEAFGWCSNLTSITLPSTLKSIASFALSLSGISSITIPASVEAIGERALNHCPNLTTITVEAGNPIFDARDNCNGIIETASNTLIQGCKSTTIPTTVTAIGNTAFTECQDLKSITIPNHISAIGDAAFNFIHNLTVTVETKDPLAINENTFSNSENITLRVPAGSKAAYAAATGWSKFDNILEGNEGSTFTAKTSEGWDMVFAILDDNEKTCQVGYIDGSWDKTAVDKEIVEGPVTIPGTVEGYTVVKIGKCALNNVDRMTSITIPNTVTSIDDYAFFSCDGLTSFELPASVTSLGTGALSAFWNVTSLTVAADNPNYDSRNNCNAIIEKATNKIVAGCQTTIIPANVTGIGTLAFDLSRGSIFIPSTITTIEESAFKCINVTIQVEHTTPLVVSEYAFSPNNSTLRVPAGTKETYAAATGWKNFSTIMEGNEGATFTAKTTEGWDMVFTVLDESAKTCQVGYIDGNWDKLAVDKESVEGSLTIPESVNNYTVVKIGKYALQNLYKMISVTIPNTVTSIEDNAFYDCNGLISFELPASVTYLGNYALSGFKKVTTLKVAEGNPKYDSRDNCNAIIEKATNKLLFGCNNTIIPASVTEIGDYAFSGLYDIVLEVEHTTPLQINEYIFQQMSNSTLRVPAGCKAAYAAATGWKNFGTILEGNEGAIITAKTIEGWDMVFTVLDETVKTCQVGYLDGNWDKMAVDKQAVEGPVTIPETVNGYTVVKIGKYAFDNVYRMTSVTIPSTVTSIDEHAFDACNGLTSLELPASLTAIGAYAFEGLSNITSVKVAEGNPKYDSRDNCNAIIETSSNKLLFGCVATIIPATVTEIGENAFTSLCDYTLTIPSTVTKINNYAFIGNNLTLQVKNTTPLDVDESVFQLLSNSVLRVPAGCKTAYAAATGWKNFGTILEGNEGSTFTAKTTEGIDMVFTILDESAKTCQVGYLDGSFDKTAVDKEIVEGPVTIPGTVEDYTVVKIGKCALQGVNRMKTVTIPNTVTSIDEYAFANCQGLTSFVLPASVTSLGSIALYDLTNVTSLSVAEGNTKYDSRNNCNAIIETSTNKLLAGCRTTTIPADVTEIGSDALCLQDCSFFIPSTITKINEYAFSNCRNLNLQVAHTDPLVINENVFNHLSNSTLRVPAGSKSAYAAATGWSKFGADNIIEDNKVTLENVEAGHLADKISDEDKFNITALTITGELNGNDFRLLREMAGNDYTGHPTEGKLQKLDLSGATIVEGGEKYLDTDRVTSSTGTYTQNVGVNSFHYATQNNVLGTSVFAGCDKLEEVILPNSITSIGDYVFWYCLNLKALEIPKNVSSIGWEFIYGPNKISKLSVAEGNQYFSSPEGSNVLMQGTRLIFGLSGAQIPAGTTIIGTEAFRDCSGLGDVIIPEGVTTIEVGAFAWSGLTSIKMPSTLTTIGNDAFAGCSGLTSFTLPQTVVSYGDGSEGGLGTLKDCVNLTSIKVEDGNPKYDSRNSCNGIIETATNTLISGCKNTVIPNTVTIIGHQAFRGINLSDFEIPNWITTLGERAFWSSSLTSIKIPSSVTKIGELAFEYCNNLTSVSVEVKTPLVITENTFSNRANATLYVPAGCKAAYEAADYWKEFSSIKEMAQPSVVTVTAKSYSRAYGEANPTFESEVTGGTVTGTPEITCAATATSNVGSYPIVIAAGTITDASVQYVNGTLTVTKAPLKISAGNYTKKQGEENPTFTLTYDGFKNNETAAVFTTQPTITCAATKDSPVGTYDITVSGAVAGNYEISYVAGTLTVEAVTPPTPMPEPKVTTFEEDVDDSSSNEVKVTFVVKESDGSSTPTVAISDDKDASGSVSIPESVTHNGVEYKVTEISEGAFQNNTSLTEVKIPASITSIGANAFAGCKNLQSITINIIVPINIAVISARGYTRAESGGVFDGVDKNTCILYVPEGSVDAYKAAAGWKEFKNILPIKTSTRIYGIEADGEVFDVYSLSGQKVKSKTTSLDGLPRGIYIINGKKVIK